MNTDQSRGGSFEERLLHELRSLVVAPASDREGRPRRTAASLASRPRRRLALAAGLAAVLAVAAAAGVPLLTGGPAPAYAVSTNDDGTVTVEISSLKDAAGLERKLRETGIDAVVQYLPAGKTCKQPWFTPLSQDHGPGHQPLTMSSVIHSGDGHTSFTIGKHHATSATLVIVAQAGADAGATSIAATFANDVRECEIVDAIGN